MKSFLTTVKIFFKECHSCNRTHIPVKSVLREQLTCWVSKFLTDIVSWNLKQIWRFSQFLLKINIKELEINKTSLKMYWKLLRSSFWDFWKVFVRQEWANVVRKYRPLLAAPSLIDFWRICSISSFWSKKSNFPKKNTYGRFH